MNYYRRNIEQHIIPAIGDIPLNKLTTRDLQKLYGVHSTGRRGTAETGARQARHATDAAKGHGVNVKKESQIAIYIVRRVGLNITAR